MKMQIYPSSMNQYKANTDMLILFNVYVVHMELHAYCAILSLNM